MAATEQQILDDAAVTDRALVPFPVAQRTLCVSRRLLKTILARNGLPVIELSPRKQAVMLAHLDMLIAMNARPANSQQTGQAING